MSELKLPSLAEREMMHETMMKGVKLRPLSEYMAELPPGFVHERPLRPVGGWARVRAWFSAIGLG